MTAQKSWELEMQNVEKQWPALLPSRYESAGGATLKVLPDNSILASGKNPQADTYTIEAKSNPQIHHGSTHRSTA